MKNLLETVKELVQDIQEKYKQELVTKVQRGLKNIEEGKTIPHKEVFSRIMKSMKKTAKALSFDLDKKMRALETREKLIQELPQETTGEATSLRSKMFLHLWVISESIQEQSMQHKYNLVGFLHLAFMWLLLESGKTRDVLIEDMRKERERQNSKFGFPQNNSEQLWFEILVEEVGEVSKAIHDKERDEVIKEMTEVATVVLAWLEENFE